MQYQGLVWNLDAGVQRKHHEEHNFNIKTRMSEESRREDK